MKNAIRVLETQKSQLEALLPNLYQEFEKLTNLILVNQKQLQDTNNELNLLQSGELVGRIAYMKDKVFKFQENEDAKIPNPENSNTQKLVDRDRDLDRDDEEDEDFKPAKKGLRKPLGPGERY